MKEICSYFNVKHSHLLTWTHCVNTLDAIESACFDKHLMMIEGDVVFMEGCATPMMASPFKMAGNMQPGSLPFVHWLNLANKFKKGIKIDFQSPEAIEPVLKILAEEEPDIPVILNADIFNLLGETGNPYEPEMFVQLAQRYFPSATLSIGWSLSKKQDDNGKIESLLIEQYGDRVDSSGWKVYYSIGEYKYEVRFDLLSPEDNYYYAWRVNLKTREITSLNKISEDMMKR